MSHKFTEARFQIIWQSMNRVDIQINGNATVETIILNEIADILLQLFRKLAASKGVKLLIEIITKRKRGRIANEP